MQFLNGYTYDGKPYTKDTNITWNHMGLPIWFSRGSLHRGQYVLEGPYTDPEGYFTVQPGEVLIRWEIPQPPPGTEQAINSPRPDIYAIFELNREFVQPRSLLHRSVNPDIQFEPGDWCAVWFGVMYPAQVVGGYRDPNIEELRDYSGALNPLGVPPAFVPPPGYIPGPPKGPPIPVDLGTDQVMNPTTVSDTPWL